MTFTGHFVDGQIIPDGPLALPDGAAVRGEVVIAPADESALPEMDDSQPTLREQLKNFLKHSLDLPEDAAENHDHYLYGTPKHGLPDQ
jgi:hypothetical protein